MNQPPKWIDSFLETILRDRFADEVLGDLHEWFHWKQEEYSSYKLKRTYFWNAFRAIRPHQLKRVKNLLITLTDHTMIHNNIKISIRSLLQHRFFTLINVLGLTISLISFLLIYAFVSHERSYNESHEKGGHIYRVLRKNMESGQRERPLPSPLAKAYLRDFEGAMEFARFGQDPVFVQLEDQRFYEDQFYWSDSSVFRIFDLPFLYGKADEALTETNTVVLTKSISEKYFGKGVNPVGQALPIKIYDGDTEMLMRIDGVVEDLPGNSDLPFQLLGSIANAFDLYSRFNDHWWFSWLHTYVYIPNASDLSRIERHTPKIVARELNEEMATHMSFDFQPLSEVHLYSEEVSGSLTDGSIIQVRVFSVVAVFILLIASINYLNLISARMNKRKKEVGIRRVMGARGVQIMFQLFTESTLAILLSFILAMGVTALVWPIFIDAIGKPIPISILFEWDAISILALVLISCALISGLYPAWLATSIRNSSLIDKQSLALGKHRMQKGLVTFQFGIAVFLVVSSVLIFRQVDYMATKDLGFDKEQLVSIKVEDKVLQNKIDIIKQAMMNVGGVVAATASGETLPSAMNNGSEMYWGESDDDHHFVNIVAVDEVFFESLGIPIIDGQNFTATSDASITGPLILNKAAADLLENDSPIGKSMRVDGNQHPVLGIVGNYHYESMKNRVQPTVFVFGEPGTRQSPDNIILRLSGKAAAETLGQLEDIWHSFSNNELFDYHFVDESFAKLHESDQRFLNMFSLFTMLSILISCLGLYGIVLFTTDERSKEISIRKVLGSSVLQVTLLVSSRFLVLITLGLVVGLPAALYFIDGWMVQFSYQLTPEPIFVSLALIFVLLVAGITIGLHTVKAALANPVNYLRNE